MSIVEFPPKTENEVKDYTLQWSAKLGESDAIDTYSFTVPSGLTLDSDLHTGTQTIVWISGGEAGTRYRIVGQIVTEDGRTYEQSFFIRVLTEENYEKLRLVRIHLGDTDASQQIFTDEDLLTLLAKYTSAYRTAYHAAMSKASFFTRKVNRSIDGLTVNYGEQAKQWMELAKSLKAEAEMEALDTLDGSAGAGFYFGGISKAESTIERLQDARKKARFRTRQFRNDHYPP